METDLIVREIQLVVAPAVMVSSAALLLLGFQTKFTNLSNRFRLLNHERRTLLKAADPADADRGRLENVSQQTDRLFKRATHVKNAIVLTFGSIALYILSSVLIFCSQHGNPMISSWVLGVFLGGLALEMAACVLMLRETALAFEVVRIEFHS